MDPITLNQQTGIPPGLTGGMTPQQLMQLRQTIQALQQNQNPQGAGASSQAGGPGSPIASPWQGLSNIASGAMPGLQNLFSTPPPQTYNPNGPMNINPNVNPNMNPTGLY